MPSLHSFPRHAVALGMGFTLHAIVKGGLQQPELSQDVAAGLFDRLSWLGPWPPQLRCMFSSIYSLPRLCELPQETQHRRLCISPHARAWWAPLTTRSRILILGVRAASDSCPREHTTGMSASHLMHKHGRPFGSLRQLGARPRVPAEHKLPASLALHHDGKGVGAVHHRDGP